MNQPLLKNKGIIMMYCLCLFMGFFAKAQTVIYSTDFGTVANVNPANWTFTGIGMNISTFTPLSSTYAGASGNAYLGEGSNNTFTNTAGNSQVNSPVGISTAVLQISTLTYSNITVSFGLRKSSTSYDANATYSLEWSTDNISYTPIAYSEPVASNWGLASGAGLTLPAGANNQPNLYLRYTFNRTGTGSNYKIDDVKVTSGASVTPANIGFLSNDTTVQESAGNAMVYLKIASTNSLVSSVNVVASVLSNASATDYTLSTTTVTFAASSANNSTQPISIAINNDALPENSEYVILKLSNPVNATISGITQFAFYIGDNDKASPAPTNALQLNLLSSFSNGAGGTNSAEIVAHDPTTQRLYIANSIGAKLDIVDFVNPSNPVLLNSLSISAYGNINSVAVRNGTVALAIENGTNPQDSGKVVFLDKNGVLLKQVNVGMMPDMITFNHAGTKVYTANEGEPNAAYTNDPDGSISIVDITGGVANAGRTHITFTAYNGQEATLRTQGIRIYGLGASASKDFEPEYITIAEDDSKAWVTLQENNAVIELNLATNAITSLRSLGSKNYAASSFGMDASNVTKGINLSNFPVKGLYLPDAISKYKVGGVDYILTANEGDARAYTGFTEEKRVAQLTLDATKFPNAAELQNNYALGRLTVTDKLGDTDNDGDIDSIFCMGARSFSIWNATTGQLVYDSGDDFERITATNSFSVMFNASNANSPAPKDRSDDKGPEPEGVTVGMIGTTPYAFIALERIGGVMVYDISNPAAPVYVTYVNNRSFATNGPDRGSEGLIFIPQSESPNGQHLVIAANEVSSTLSIWGIPGCTTPLNSALTVATNTVFCQGDSTLLSVAAQSGMSYQWKNNTNTISGAINNTYYAKAAGNYKVTITGGTNCSTSSLSQSIAVTAAPVLTVIATNSAVCMGQPVTITASGADTYTFTGGISNGVAFTPSASATYSISGTSTLTACKAKTTRSITVKALPSIAGVTTSSMICTGQTTTLSAVGSLGTTYTWTPGNLNGTSVAVSPTTTTTYTINGLNSNGCSNMTTVTQSVSLCTGLEDLAENESLLNVFPNPNNGNYTIQSNTALSLTIIDQLGREMNTVLLNVSNHFTADISGMAAGIYYLVNREGQQTKHLKIVVTK
jgi:hypothetical protein